MNKNISSNIIFSITNAIFLLIFADILSGAPSPNNKIFSYTESFELSDTEGTASSGGKGFSVAASRWIPKTNDGWNMYSIETGDAKEGSFFIALTHQCRAVYTLTEHINSGNIVIIKFYAKSQGHDGPDYRNCVQISSYETHDGHSRNEKYTEISIIKIKESTDWIEYSGFMQIPENTKSVSISILKYGKHKGVTCADEFSIEVIRAESTGKKKIKTMFDDGDFSFLGGAHTVHPQLTDWLSADIPVNTVHKNYAYGISGGLSKYIPCMPLRTNSFFEYTNDIAYIMKLSDAQISALIPKRSGVYFVGCPNCDTQAQGSEFFWDISKPETIKCVHCAHEYPSKKYPAEKTISITAPSGKVIQYDYFENSSEKKRFFFSAGADYRRQKYWERALMILGGLYGLTGNEKYAEKASYILLSLVKAYPDFAYKWDNIYPIVFYNGPVIRDAYDARLSDSKKFGPRHYIIGRWDWWAYFETAFGALLCYDQIYNSPALLRKMTELGVDRFRDIERNFFQEQSMLMFRYIDPMNNMSPAFWKSAIAVGRITGVPDFIHVCMHNFEKYIDQRFFFDGFWGEPSVSYHYQSSESAFVNLFSVISNYSDPKGYNSKYSSYRYDKFNPVSDGSFGEKIAHTIKAGSRAVYPDGRLLPMGDTKTGPPPESPVLKDGETYLMPATGHAVLCGGSGTQHVQLHLFWTPRSGHVHYDVLGMTMWANGREIISDLGYTHTRYAPWAKATVSHNCVVIDYKNQPLEGKDLHGVIEYMDIDNPDVQIISVDGKRINSGNTYMRTMFLIKTSMNGYYAADFFQAGGGSTYDYFLHGSADEKETLSFENTQEINLQAKNVEIISQDIPGKWNPPATEKDRWYTNKGWSYGFLRNTKQIKFGYKDTFIKSVFRGNKNGFAVYTPVPKQRAFSVWSGESCAGARKSWTENELLEKDFRKFIMLRNESEETVTFQNIIEPFEKKTIIQNVDSPFQNVLTITYSETDTREITDLIFITTDSRKKINIAGRNILFSGKYGFVSVRHKKETPGGQIIKMHIVNGSIKIDNEKELISKGERKLLTGTPTADTVTIAEPLPENKDSSFSGFIRITHSDESAHGYFFKKIGSSTLLTVKDVLGFTFISPEHHIIKYTSLPGKQLMGKNYVNFFSVIKTPPNN